MQLGQIRAFLAVREAGSLRAAARRIGISQPAISKALAALERDLGAELFIRTSRGVRMTEAVAPTKPAASAHAAPPAVSNIGLSPALAKKIFGRD